MVREATAPAKTTRKRRTERLATTRRLKLPVSSSDSELDFSTRDVVEPEPAGHASSGEGAGNRLVPLDSVDPGPRTPWPRNLQGKN